MKNILRRSLSWLLILVMVLGMVPQAPVFATDETLAPPVDLEAEEPVMEIEPEAAADDGLLTDSATEEGQSVLEESEIEPSDSLPEMEPSEEHEQEDGIVPQLSYPLIYTNTTETNWTIPYGETGVVSFTIWPEYKNERYNVYIYDSSGNLVGSASNAIYNTSSLPRKCTITVNTSKLNMKPGTYKIKYWMDFYSLYEWHSAPNSYTKTLTVVENVCNGSHTFVQKSVYTEPTCKKEGMALMKCSRCGHEVYQTLPTSDHVYDEGIETTAPTATTTGIRTYTCTVCNATTTVSIPALETAPEKPYKIANVVSGVHVYWNAVEGAQKYGLWRSETGKDGTYKWIANPTVPHFTDTKVVSGKTYYYKVTILNTEYNVHTNKSEAIGVIFVSTPDLTLRVNRAVGIGLRWDAIEGATGYAIYRKSYYGTDDWVRVGTVSGGDTVAWDDASVKNNNGEVYRYTIRALAGSDMKTLSGCRNTGRTMVRLTSQTLSSAAAASKNSIKCTWTTNAQATGYEVRFMVGSTVYKTVTIGNPSTSTKTFTGLASGNTYKIQVRSYKKVEGVGSFYSAWSTAKNVKLG